MRSAIALLLMCGILGAERISAQNSSVEVRLSLSVTDASGAAVSVGENDVKILENGVEQKITGFSERTGISKIGFIMDNSGSMRMRLDEINEIAKAIAGTMGDTDEAFILRLVGVDNTAIWLDWTSSKQNIEKAVNDMYIEGGQTSIINALNIAWKKLEPRISQDPNRKYSLVLISDAEERAGLAGYDELIGKLQTANVQVNVVALTEHLEPRKRPSGSTRIVIGGKNEKLSKEEKERLKNPQKAAEKLALNLAFQTGGRAYMIKKESDISVADIANALQDEAKSQYLVRYSTIAKKPSQRKLKVEIADGPGGQKRYGHIREEILIPEYE